MITQCHLISSQIVQFAVDQNVGVLCVEQLHGIGKREMKQSRDKRELNQWSYYRLIDNIRYKAQREGLRLVLLILAIHPNDVRAAADSIPLTSVFIDVSAASTVIAISSVR